MDLFLADDARQNHPSRDGMTGPLVAFGGLHVPDGVVGEAERGIERLCAKFGFPPGEPFTWSPRRDHWMRTNLVDDRRREFFTRVLTSLRERDCHALSSTVKMCTNLNGEKCTSFNGRKVYHPDREVVWRSNEREATGRPVISPEG